MDTALLIWVVALTILVIVGIVWVLDLQARLRRLQRRYESVFTGGEDASLTVALESLASRLAETTARTERLVARAEQIDATLAHTVQGVGLVRFRAFQDTGGDQSFALALADGEGNGVVISALYGRDATRIYAKPVQNWLSPKALSEEEKQALAQARQTIVGRD
ncbi:MAG TPA: DUF4446 family protein [Thermoflexia bacterium]|nr:MAG: hypothetical protein DRI80_08500 [Chloroflexota bacterium]HEY67099.1 DUF4446 family protein [Thermoflexia bacterium]